MKKAKIINNHTIVINKNNQIQFMLLFEWLASSPTEIIKVVNLSEEIQIKLDYSPYCNLENCILYINSNS